MMKIKIEQEKENPFLGRKEIKIYIDHTGDKTPTKAALQAFLSKELKAQQDKIQIRKIFSIRGKGSSVALVNVWKDKVVGIEKPKEKPEKKEEKKPEAEKQKLEEGKKEAAEKEAKKEDKAKEPESEAKHKEAAKPKPEQPPAEPKKEEKAAKPDKEEAKE